MKYFLDTEFIESPGSIQLISIGVISEDGHTFYAENTSFDERDADDWVRENVLNKLRWWGTNDVPFNRCEINREGMGIYEAYGPLLLIRKALIDFFDADNSKIEIWGYFADYDWVIFCWIFGKMIDLPKHFPMYCNDIKQLMVEHSITDKVDHITGKEHNALEDALWNKSQYHEVVGQSIGFKKSFIQIEREKLAEFAHGK